MAVFEAVCTLLNRYSFYNMQPRDSRVKIKCEMWFASRKQVTY